MEFLEIAGTKLARRMIGRTPLRQIPKPPHACKTHSSPAMQPIAPRVVSARGSPQAVAASAGTEAASNTTTEGSASRHPTTRRRSSRIGCPNYHARDMETLVGLVDAVKPVNTDDWASIANQYAQWAAENGRLVRDISSLQTKFTKLSCSKRTGRPVKPGLEQRAVAIGLAINQKSKGAGIDLEAVLNGGDAAPETDDRAAPGPVEGVRGDDGPVWADVLVAREDAGVMTDGDGRAASEKRGLDGEVDFERPGKRAKVRTAGDEAGGLASANVGMIGHIAEMSKSITDLSKCMVQAQGQLADAVSNSVSKDAVREVVREEVASQLKATNDALQQLNTMVTTFIARFQQ